MEPFPRASAVFHTVHLDFAQTGKNISLTPPPNSGVKLLPGVVTPVCVKLPILGMWAIVMLQLELQAQDRAWAVFVQCFLGNSPSLPQLCQPRQVPQPWEPGFGKAVKDLVISAHSHASH